MEFHVGRVGSSVATSTSYYDWRIALRRHEFEWKKEECFLLRKPDPPVLIAVTEPEKKNKKAIVQFLDYNLMRYATVSLPIESLSDVVHCVGSTSMTVGVGFFLVRKRTCGHADTRAYRSRSPTSGVTPLIPRPIR